MTPKEVKEHFKTQYNFNKETGMSPATLGNWLKWGYVPENSQYKLERMTKCKLQVGLVHKNTDVKKHSKFYKIYKNSMDLIRVYEIEKQYNPMGEFEDIVNKLKMALDYLDLSYPVLNKIYNRKKASSGKS